MMYVYSVCTVIFCFPLHQVPFARYVVQQNITYLKRYAISSVYRENKVQGFRPRECLECQFDIVSPTQARYTLAYIMCDMPYPVASLNWQCKIYIRERSVQ